MLFVSSWSRRAALSATLLACASCHRPAAPENISAPPSAATATASLSPDPSAAPPPRGPRDYPMLREMLGQKRATQFPLERVEEEPKRFTLGSAAIAGAPDFLFVLGQGSGWNGFDTLKVEASGQVELVFGGGGENPWKRVVFQLSSDELTGLQRELAAIDVFALKRAYLANVDDGTQWFVRVRAAQQRKTVVLDNHFPDPIVRLADHVRTRIIPAHRSEIAAAAPFPEHRKLGEPMRWPEDSPAPAP